MEYQYLKSEVREDGITIMTVSAPKSLNALNSTVLKEIDYFVSNLDTKKTRVLIITGDGEKSFVAGADISEMVHLYEKEGYEFSKLGAIAFRKIELLPIPVIAAVNGFFDREQRLSNDPYLETREKEDAFLQRVLETMERGMQAASISGLAVLLQNASSDVPKPAEQDTSAVDEDLETALDFVNSL